MMNMPKPIQMYMPKPVQPGDIFSADINIVISDQEVPADFAAVKINQHIPLSGRATTATPREPARYIAPLPVMPVRLQKDTFRYFSLAPSAIIENHGSPQAWLRLEIGISGRLVVNNRGWGPETLTNFKIQATVRAGGRSDLIQSALFVSCMDEDTPVLVAGGQALPVRVLVPGDWIQNPISRRSVRVAEVIRGPQAFDTMYLLGYGSTAALFTEWHPMLTRRGVVPAGQVTREDALLGEDGSFHPVSVMQVRSGACDRSVYNLRLEAVKPEDHWLCAAGIVTGDYEMQNAIQSTGDCLHADRLRPAVDLACVPVML